MDNKQVNPNENTVTRHEIAKDNDIVHVAVNTISVVSPVNPHEALFYFALGCVVFSP